jgi:hypothetical protein
MQLSFMCAEEQAYANPFEWGRNLVASGGAGRLMYTSTLNIGRNLANLCAFWKVERAVPETYTPLRTNVPTLVVAGQFDQITPPAYGRNVARHATRGQYVEVAGVGHSPLLGAGVCGLGILNAFVAAPTARVDTSCLPPTPSFLVLPAAPGVAATGLPAATAVSPSAPGPPPSAWGSRLPADAVSATVQIG